MLKTMSVEFGSSKDQGQDDQLSQVEERDLFPHSHSNHSPRHSKQIQEKGEKWSALLAPVKTVKGTLPNCQVQRPTS